MPRTITLLFRRDPSKDRIDEKVAFEGYDILWPDGEPAKLAVDALCKHGQRLFGLGKYLKDCNEKLIDMKFYPLNAREDSLTRIPGHRVRRFYLHKQGNSGRVHFLDGTPTSIICEIGRDEPEVIEWLGLEAMEENGIQWFDLAASPSESDFRADDEAKKSVSDKAIGISQGYWNKSVPQTSLHS